MKRKKTAFNFPSAICDSYILVLEDPRGVQQNFQC